jgi:hypothetical protein
MFAMILSALNAVVRTVIEARELQLAMHKHYPHQPE